MSLDGLSRREREVLEVVLRRGRATAAELERELPDFPSYGAVRSALRGLVAKRRVRRDAAGRAHVYRPIQSPGAARESAARTVLRRLFGGDSEAAVLALLRSEDLVLSEAEVERLRGVIATARRRKRE
jgi:predicted transcriptional regulator